MTSLLSGLGAHTETEGKGHSLDKTRSLPWVTRRLVGTRRDSGGRNGEREVWRQDGDGLR